MLRSIATAAKLTVGRDCAFAVIGIVALMAHSLNDVLHALKLGAWSFLSLSLLFWLRATLAMRFPYRRTDVWSSLAHEHRPNDRFAQQLIGRAIRNASLQMALLASCLSTGLLIIAILVEFTDQPSLHSQRSVGG